jgi:carbon storage regulator CsrA
MLVLSRKVSERIRVRLEDGRDIWITLVDVDRNKVRIGVAAPTTCRIDREENIGKQPPPRVGSGAGRGCDVMACPICDSTVQHLGNLGVIGKRIWWCPRCGTLVTVSDEGREADVPAWTKVIEREIVRDVVKARGGRADGGVA